MSAIVLDFPRGGHEVARRLAEGGMKSADEGGGGSDGSRLPPEIFYKIFCSGDAGLQDLAMEYFLLECD